MDDRSSEKRVVFFVDVDGCLYSRRLGIAEHIAALASTYFQNHLGCTSEQADLLYDEYVRDYGLAVEGLCRQHGLDSMEFNRSVDDALPLDSLLTKDLDLRNLLLSIDRSRVKLWLFTNAYSRHGLRVVRLLGIEDLFEGITFCDYEQQPLVLKPMVQMFQKAEREAGVGSQAAVYFADDSLANCRASLRFGWSNTVHLDESDGGTLGADAKMNVRSISGLRELPKIFPELFV